MKTGRTGFVQSDKANETNPKVVCTKLKDRLEADPGFMDIIMEMKVGYMNMTGDVPHAHAHY